MSAQPISPRLRRLGYLLSSVPIMLASVFSQPSRAAGTAIIWVDHNRFHVEIAETLEERQQGLMFRERMPLDHGMLFIQPQAAPTAFWMKNTLIPLDMLFFDSDGRLLEIRAETPPCTVPVCPTYSSDGPIKYILELNAGSAQRLGLRPGARLRLK